VQNFVLCVLFTAYFSLWQVYSDLDPLGLQTHNLFTPFSVPLLERRDYLVASCFSGVRLCNRIEKNKKLGENKTVEKLHPKQNIDK